MAVKGGLWIGLILLALLVLIILTLMSGSDDGWCNLAVNAGDCQIFGQRFCYCIATFGDAHPNHTKELGIYERSEEHCHTLNGTIAVPDQVELVIWLAKRMFDTGVDKALVGLRMIGSSWFWMHQSGAVRATNINWRQDFPPRDEDSHAMITVETARKEGHDVDYYYGVQYLNYDYYLKNDRNPCLCSADEKVELSTSGHVVTFQTPRYPSNYCSDSNCRWIISINDGYAIKLEWLVFSTEHLMDFVYVYDGPSDDSPLLASCSGSMCTSQRSSSNQMQIHFHSDHVTTDLGFKAKVTGIEHDECFCSESSSIVLVNLHDSFTLFSPKFPQPYCVMHQCGWTIEAPKESGLQLKWNFFDTDPDADFVYVYNEEKLVKRCSGTTCSDFISSGNQLHVEFISDAKTSQHTGIQATVTVVINCMFLKKRMGQTLWDLDCERLTLAQHAGSVTYSSIRDDGYIPAGANATYSCPNNTKVKDTNQQTTDVLTCEPPIWNRQLPTCVPVCHVQSLVTVDLHNIHFCTWQEAPRPMIQVGESIVLERYDLINQSPIGGAAVFECTQNGWPSEQPSCNEINARIDVGMVALIGGEKLSTIQSFNPAYPGRNLLTSYIDELHEGFIALPHDDKVLIAGGTISAFYFHMESSTVITAPEMLSTRYDAGATIFGEVVVVCGGYENMIVLSSCEQLKDHQWLGMSPLTQGRYGLEMLSIDQKIYIVGGWLDKTKTPAMHMEQWDVNRGWEELETTPPPRHAYKSVVFHEHILICGDENQWSAFPSLRVARREHAMVSALGTVYVFGGMDNFGSLLQSIEIFDTRRHLWVIAATETITSGPQVAVGLLGPKDHIVEHQWSVDGSQMLHVFCMVITNKESIRCPEGASFGFVAAAVVGVSSLTLLTQRQETSPTTSFKTDCLGINDITKKAIYLDDRCFVHHTREKLSQKASQDRCAALYPRGRLAVIDQTKIVVGLLDLSNGIWTALLQGPLSNAVWQTKIYGQNKTITLENLPWAAMNPRPSDGEGLLVRYDGFANAQLESQHSFLCQFAHQSNKTQLKLFAKEARASNVALMNRMSVADAYICGTACIDLPECRAFSFSTSTKQCELYWHIGDTSTIDIDHDTSSIFYTKALLDTDCISPIDCLTDLPKLLLVTHAVMEPVTVNFESYYPGQSNLNAILYNSTQVKIGLIAVLVEGRVVVTAHSHRARPAELSQASETIIYDPSTNTLSSGASTVEPRHAPAAAVLDQTVIMCGGFSSAGSHMSSCERFSDGQWSLMTASLNAGRWAFRMVNLHNKLYAVGGVDVAGLTYVPGVERYDTVTHVWTTLADPTPTLAQQPGLTVFKDEIVLCGGHTASGSVDSCHTYSDVTDDWRVMAKMIQPRHGLALVAFHGHIYAFRGADGDRQVEKFDPQMGQWVVESETIQNYFAAAIVV